MSNFFESNSFHLALTDLKGGWRFDRKNLFLWSGSITYENKDLLESLDYKISDPYGIQREQKINDLDVVNKLRSEVFLKLVELLNDYHKVNHSERYWNILLGHWLTRFLKYTYNRLNTLAFGLESYQISDVTLLHSDQQSYIPLNTSQTLLNFDSSYWRWFFDSEVFLALSELNNLKQINVSFYKQPKNLQQIDFGGGKRQSAWIYDTLSFMSHLLSNNSNGLILNTYLPKLDEIKLNLKIKNLPYFWPRLDTSVIMPDISLRDTLSNKLEKNLPQVRSKIIARLLLKQIPICFIEGYRSEKRKATKIKPTKPKFVFTSNNFDTDDVFKFWLAQKVEAGSKYIVGQHGNNYGTNFFDSLTVEEVTSDIFFTWGWKDGDQPYVKAFNFKAIGKKKYIPSKASKRITLITPPKFAIHETWDVDFEYSQNFNEQLSFVANLGFSSFSNLQIRLHLSQYQDSWRSIDRWNKMFPEIYISDKNLNFDQIISESKLLVFAYDSTGILECLALNVPFIAFWTGQLDHLTDESKDYYQMLVDAEIIHFSGKAAAEFIDKIVPDISGWWNSKKVKYVREIFAGKYSREVADPLTLLAKHLQ